MKHITPFLLESKGSKNRFPRMLAILLFEESTSILGLIEDIGHISKDELYIKELLMNHNNQGGVCDFTEILITGKPGSQPKTGYIVGKLEKVINYDCVETLLQILYSGAGKIEMNIFPSEGDSIEEEEYRKFSKKMLRNYPNVNVSKNMVTENFDRLDRRGKLPGKKFIGSININIKFENL